jgi:cobyrinic acid a,c-diamide synthase
MNHAIGPPGLIIAAPRSGAGKTTVTLGLLRAFARRGFVVQPFKCGPDYVDPAFHALAAGRPSFNLDSWAMPADTIATLATGASTGAELAIVEGVMGLFDGAAASGRSGSGTTADLASLLGWPVVLVLDVAGQTETAAAVALGCAQYRDDIEIAGVILNRVASERHFALIAPAFDRMKMPIYGSILRDDRMALPERHLGLVQAQEIPAVDERLDRLADIIDAAVDVDGVRRSARAAKVLPERGEGRRRQLQPPGQRIALAQDAAFSFMYPHLLRQWREAGAEISRRWPIRLPMRRPTPSGCPEAIPNCTPARWRRPGISAKVLAKLPAVPFPSMVSAAAIWCWGAGSRTPTGTSTR